MHTALEYFIGGKTKNMFICNKCLQQYYQNNPNPIRSYGPCEFCQRTKTCSDILSSCLIPRKKKVRLKTQQLTFENILKELENMASHLGCSDDGFILLSNMDHLRELWRNK